MEVTRKNYVQVLPEIEAAINAADFMSIDGEFTGLSKGQSISSFDSPEECYRTLREDSKNFLLIQFGLTTFRWDADSKKYFYSTYVFYLFPRPEIKSTPDKIFSCQSSSIDFLARHKFDFNKLFHEGISYIDTMEETKLREHTDERHNLEKSAKNSNDDSFSRRLINIPDNIQPQIDEICGKVQSLVEKKEKKTLRFDKLNSFIRRLVFQEIESKFQDSVHIESVIDRENPKNRILEVSYGLTERDISEKLDNTHKKELADIDIAVGFSTVARLITDSKKLVIGHNSTLDVLHMVNEFFYPLPQEYKEFKSLTSHIFESYMDTMYVAKSNTFKELISSFDLKTFHEILSKDPFKSPPIEAEKKLCGYDSNSSEYHNAGYDSFVTGRCLIAMFEYLKSQRNTDEMILDNDCDLMKSFYNKLFLYKTAYQGSPCINLKGNDPNPHREHVFHIKFPTDWTKNDIYNVFDTYGGLSVIDFIDNTSAYVALKNHSKSQIVTSELCKATGKYCLTPFSKFKKLSSVNDVKNTEQPTNPIRSYLKRKFKEEDVGEPLTKDTSKDELSTAEKPGGSEAVRRPKERKLSHTSSGDFIICEDKKNISNISSDFEVSDNWE